jgi:hypothetical protein
MHLYNSHDLLSTKGTQLGRGQLRLSYFTTQTMVLYTYSVSGSLSSWKRQEKS